MLHECSPGESLARTAFMHQDDKGNNALKPHTVLKGLTRKPGDGENKKWEKIRPYWPC